MRISVKVTPGSTESEIKEVGERNFKIKIKAPPEKGKANKELVERVADYFDVPKARVSIVRGFASRKKIIEIKDK